VSVQNRPAQNKADDFWKKKKTELVICAEETLYARANMAGALVRLAGW
jgi:hypothetical protein